MSKVSDIYEALLDVLEAQLPSYTRIPNAYDAGATPEPMLRKAYGIGFGPSSNTNRVVGCQMSVARTFDVLIVRQVTTTENNTAARAALEKEVFEAQKLVIAAIENNPSLSQTCANAAFVSDSGLDFVTGQTSQQKYFLLVSTFACEYLENLS